MTETNPEDTNFIINELMKNFFFLKQNKDEIDEEIKKVRSELETICHMSGIDNFTDDCDNVLTYKEQKGRKSLDRAKVKAKLAPEIFDECFTIGQPKSVLKLVSKDSQASIAKMLGKK